MEHDAANGRALAMHAQARRKRSRATRFSGSARSAMPDREPQSQGTGMPSKRSPHNLDELLDEILAADPDAGKISAGELLEAVGKRSFAPLLLLLALLAFTPVGGVPGVPTALAAIVMVTAGQILFGRRRFWLPKFVLRRGIDSGGLRKTIGWLRPFARWVDRLIKPRLVWLLQGAFLRVAALGCIVTAMTIPPLEIIPFAGTVSWAAIGIFGLAIIAEDGALALVALGFSIGAGLVVAFTLF
jgi:hypothetical protein